MSRLKSEQGVADLGLLLFFGLLLAGLLVAVGAWFGRGLQGQVSSWIPVLLLLFGLVFLMIEAAVPGFGVFGFTGLLLLAAGIMALGANTQNAVRALGITLVTAPILAGLMGWYAAKHGYWRRLALGTQQSSETGYVSAPDLAHLVGKEGLALTMLRPAGAAEIEGQRVDVVTEGGMIAAGTPIFVRKVEGYRIVVERLSDAGKQA